MAKNEPNKPDETKTATVTETTAPEMSAEESKALAHECEAVLHDIGDDGLEPPAPFDIPAPGDVVVPFDKVRETAREVEKTFAPEKQEAEKSDKSPNKRERRGKIVRQETQEAGTEDTRKEPEEQLSEAEPKKHLKPRSAKQKSAAEKRAPAKEEVPVPEQPPELKEAPRKGEPEQIVFINLSEFHGFKDYLFGVRDDEEMRAMLESVKDKGVTQPAIVRPREDGGYEIVSGHRRLKASELAGYFEMHPLLSMYLNYQNNFTILSTNSINKILKCKQKYYFNTRSTRRHVV